MNEKSRAGEVLLCSISVTHGMGLKYPYYASQRTARTPDFFLFFWSLSQSTPDHGPGTPKFTGKSPFSPQPSVPRTGGWHQSTGVFIARKTVPYSSACHVPPSLFIYITIPGAGGDSPAVLGGNDVIRRLLHVGRRRRGRHSTGVLF